MENHTPPPPPPPPSAPPPPPPVSPDRPATYYETENAGAAASKKGCPKGLLIGCGGGGCLLIVIAIAAIVYMMRDGGGRFIGQLLSPLQDSVVEMTAGDVTAEQKETFRREMEQLEVSLGNGDVNVVRVQPVIDQLRQAVEDKTVTAEEMDSLNEMLLEINEREAPPATAPSAGTVEL